MGPTVERDGKIKGNRMVSRMNCQEFEELAGAYVLEALSEEELQAANAHLAGCVSCMYLVQQLREVTEALPLAVAPHAPSSHVKDRLLATIRAEQALAVQTTSDLPSLPRSITQSRSERRQPRRWSVPVAAAVAALVLVLVGGLTFWNVSLQQQVGHLSTKQPAPVVSAAYTLNGTGQAAGAQGKLIYLPEEQMTVLILRGLPELAGTEVYQGWLLQGKQPVSIGLFNVRNGVATLNFLGDVHGYDAAAVSLEHGPQASLAAPKGPVVALGSLPAS